MRGVPDPASEKERMMEVKITIDINGKKYVHGLGFDDEWSSEDRERIRHALVGRVDSCLRESGLFGPRKTQTIGGPPHADIRSGG